MQSSSNALSTPVAVKRICKQKKNYTYTLNPCIYAEVADIPAQKDVRQEQSSSVSLPSGSSSRI